MTGQGVLIEEDAAEAMLNDRVKRIAGKGTEASVTAQAWLSLERERRDLEARLKTIVTNQERVRQRLLDEWSTAGINKESVQGYTIHTQRKLYPKVKNPGALAAALKKEDLDDLLTVDEKAFAIYVTACEENETPLPESVAEQIADQFERFAIVVRMPSGHGN